MGTETIPQAELQSGGMYFHQGNPDHKYLLLEFGITEANSEHLPFEIIDATGFEGTGELRQFPGFDGETRWVIYQQKYQGKLYDPGTIWVREENDFVGYSEVDGQLVPNFTRELYN